MKKLHTSLDYNQHKEIEELLLGRKVVAVRGDTMTLDNGTEVEVIPNQGCGGCSNGWYYLDELNACEAVITSVRLDEESKEGESWEEAYTYSIFVLAANKEMVLLSVSGDDGCGYYGTGYRLNVRVKE